MKAAVLKAFGSPLSIEILPDPQARAGEVVVDVVAAPVLSYAAEVFSGTRQYPLQLPMAVGAGAIGRVRAVGPDATRLVTGDWVFCDPTVRSRDDATAPDVMLQGLIAPSEGAKRLQAHFRHGPFAEQMMLPMENAIRIGELGEICADRWCFLSALAIPYGGLLAAELQAGETVLISGATGFFGSAGIAVALAMGAGCAVAPGRNQAALEDLIRRFGSRVKTVVLTGDPDKDRELMQQAAPGPIDKVVDILPPLPDANPVRAAVMTVRPHGIAVLMGGLRAGLELPYPHLMRNCITVRGQYMYPRDAPARLVSLIRSGLLSLTDLQVKSFALDQANDAVGHAAANGGPFRYTVIKP